MYDEIIVTHVRLYQDDAGEYRWTAFAGNERAVATAGEGYRDFLDALRPAASFFPNATVRDETGSVPEVGANAADAYESLRP